MTQPSLKVTIRPLKGEDWHDCYEIWQAPRVLWGTLGLPSQSEDEVREKVANPPPSMHRLAAVVEGKVVGMTTVSVGRRRRSHVGYVGVSVHDDYSGAGHRHGAGGSDPRSGR